MGVLARGSVTDRPWGMTLGALGLRGLTGQLTLAGQYKVAFQQGAVVGAFSPLANDAAVRLALTGNLITSSQVGDITRRIAASPHRDEIEVLAEICRLAPEQAQRLRRRLVAQRAARTFAIDQGEFVVDDTIDVAVVPGSELDVRAIVFLGAKNNLNEDRLAAELAQLGVWFKLKPQALDDLPYYGFSDDEKPVLQLLVQGVNLADLEYANSALGARAVRAIAYSLAACGGCDASATPGPAMARTPGMTAPPPNVQRAPSTTVQPQTMPRGTTIPPPVGTDTKHKTAPLGSRSPAAPSIPPATSRAPTTQPATGRAPTPGSSPPLRTRSPSIPPRGRTPTEMPPPRPSDPSLGNGAPGMSRTITQSSGVPREADGRNSSEAHAAAATGSFKAARDRSPSAGVPRARSPSRAGSSTMPPVPRARTSSSQSMRAFATPAAPAMPAMPSMPARKPTIRRKHNTGATMEIEALLQKKLPMLDQGVDYFTLFGLPIGASPDDVRSTYFMLARKLHPDRLSAIGIEDDDRQAQRLMACINEAFSVLNDPIRRAEYISILNRGGADAVRAEEQKADELAMKIMRAEEEFRQGEMMLRREQIAQAVQHFQAAVELAPNEAEYQALLAWALFAQAQDKSAVAQQTRRALIRAAEANSESPTAHFYLGRVERMLGREKEALYCFYQVLKIKPNHSEATSEARILEQRLKARR